MMPNPAYLRADHRRRALAHPPTCPYYAGWYRFLEFWNSSDRMYPGVPGRPRLGDARAVSISAPERQAAHPDDEPPASASSTATTTCSPGCSPTTRRSASASSRTAAGSRRCAATTSTSSSSRSIGSRPTASSPVTASTTQLDVLVLATGFHAAAVPVADGDPRPRGTPPRRVGRRAARLPRHHRSRLPEPLLPLRAEHEPGRRQRHLHARVPGRLRRSAALRALVERRRRGRWSAVKTSTTSTTHASTPSTSRWCGDTRGCTATTTTTTAASSRTRRGG